MRAVVTVTGKDKTGIIAKVSTFLSEKGANIEDISQTILGEYFAMIMIASLDGLKIPFADFVDELSGLGRGRGLDIHTMHEDIFNTMHHI